MLYMEGRELMGGAGRSLVVSCRGLNGSSKRLCIQKRFDLSPRLFFKGTEMINVVFKSVLPINNVEILSLNRKHLKN